MFKTTRLLGIKTSAFTNRTGIKSSNRNVADVLPANWEVSPIKVLQEKHRQEMDELIHQQRKARKALQARQEQEMNDYLLKFRTFYY